MDSRPLKRSAQALKAAAKKPAAAKGRPVVDDADGMGCEEDMTTDLMDLLEKDPTALASGLHTFGDCALVLEELQALQQAVIERQSGMPRHVAARKTSSSKW